MFLGTEISPGRNTCRGAGGSRRNLFLCGEILWKSAGAALRVLPSLGQGPDSGLSHQVLSGRKSPGREWRARRSLLFANEPLEPSFRKEERSLLRDGTRQVFLKSPPKVELFHELWMRQEVCLNSVSTEPWDSRVFSMVSASREVPSGFGGSASRTTGRQLQVPLGTRKQASFSSPPGLSVCPHPSPLQFCYFEAFGLSPLCSAPPCNEAARLQLTQSGLSMPTPFCASHGERARSL